MEKLKPIYQVNPETPLSGDLIKDAIDFNEKRRKRYNLLDDYYIGRQCILERKKPETYKNNRVMVNHAKYITDLYTGYLLGNPVDYQSNDVNLEPVLENYKRQTIANLDAEIAKECSIFGVKYEYVYSDEQSRPNSVGLDVRNTIIVYDNTMLHRKLYGINYRPIYKDPEALIPDHFDVLAVTPTEIVECTLTGGSLKEIRRSQHAFGDVPIIEYKNNGECLGDFEPVISLIDAYNLLQSDRVNDREQLVDAILCFIGMDFDKEQMAMLREQRALSHIPTDGDVKYLTKNVSESDADVLRQTLEKDIHKISMVPNMSDENFVGNASGVALRYKLLTFEQSTKTKERFFEKGLLERFKLYSDFLHMKSAMPEIEISDVDAVFTRNLPSNDLETAQMINYLLDVVDKETLVSRLSFVKDASEVVEAVEAEKEKSAPANNYAGNEFGSTPQERANDNLQESASDRPQDQE